MADGSGAKPPIAGGVSASPKLSAWLFGTRSGLLTLWAVVAALSLTVPIVIFVAALGYQLDEPTRWYLLAASTLLWLPLTLFALDPEDTVASGPRVRLPIVTSIILVCLTILAVADKLTNAGWLDHTPQRLAFFSFLALAFVPRLWNATLFAYHKARNRRAAEDAARRQATAAPASSIAVEERLESYRNAESLGAVLATILFFGIVGGAIYLGTLHEGTTLGTGIGQIIFMIVVALFATIVFLDWIARFPPLRATAKAFNRLAPRMNFLVAFYDLLDTALVRLGSHVAGADHLKTRSRYGILIVTLGCLAVLAWFLPPPLGLTPVIIGLVVALSLSRLWAWVEEDRDMASITGFSPLAPQRVGFREDYRDETLLGFIFVLMLLPIAWMQVDQGVTQIFQQGANHEPVQNPQDFGMWLGYFGFELAKALPIVDWADIYKLGPGDANYISPFWPSGAHAVFMARALVDLILIASFLQAIAIANRNAQQKSLYAVGHVNRLDELVEKAALSRAIRETRRAESGKQRFDLSRMTDTELVDFRRYDLSRLRQMYATSRNDEERKAFLEQIFDERGETLDPAIVVAQNIAATHRNELQLIRTFEQALADHRSQIHRIDLDDIRVIMFELRNTSGMKAFKEQLLDVAEREVDASVVARVLMLREIGIGKDGSRDLFQYTTRMAAERIRRLLPGVNDCQTLKETLEETFENGPRAFGGAAAAYNMLVDALHTQIARVCM